MSAKPWQHGGVSCLTPILLGSEKVVLPFEVFVHTRSLNRSFLTEAFGWRYLRNPRTAVTIREIS